MAVFNNGAFRPHTTSTIASGSMATQSAPFVHIGGVARIVATEDIYIEIGQNPTATTDSMMITKGVPTMIIVSKDERVSVLQVSTPGIVSIAEID